MPDSEWTNWSLWTPLAGCLLSSLGRNLPLEKFTPDSIVPLRNIYLHLQFTKLHKSPTYFIPHEINTSTSKPSFPTCLQRNSRQTDNTWAEPDSAADYRLEYSPQITSMCITFHPAIIVQHAMLLIHLSAVRN